MTELAVTRTKVLLSLQRALLGEVFPALREVTVDWSDSSVKFFAYVDGELAPEDEESLSCVSAEVAADFWSGMVWSDRLPGFQAVRIRPSYWILNKIIKPVEWITP